jgi:hypothetical protein
MPQELHLATSSASLRALTFTIAELIWISISALCIRKRCDTSICWYNCKLIFSNIPNGTYPEERLVDGAIGAIEDTTEFVPINLEAPLDFDSTQPLIYPQELVLFQEDDEYYESTGNFNGFWNSKYMPSEYDFDVI